MATRAPAIGRVSSFDERIGLGEVTAGDGRVLPFHCTAISDGSRSIEVGAVVTFLVAPGGRGRWEATCVAPS